MRLKKVIILKLKFKQVIIKRLFAAVTSAVTALSFVSYFSGYEEISAEEEKKLIALTFDDGPNLTVTQQILDLFEENGGKATFFLIGNNINSATESSVKRAYEMGCEIANHSKSHQYMTDRTKEDMLNEVGYVDEYVYKITGEHTKFFRAPFLNTSEEVYDTIAQTFISGVMIEDVSTDPEVRAKELLRVAKDGLIVLMHDSEANQPTVEALKIALPELKKQGYEFVTVSELFEMQGETPLGDRSYSEVTKYPCGSYSVYKNLFSGKAEGENGWSGWNEIGALDKNLLSGLGEDFAIEINYSSMAPPVIVIQKWGANQMWKSIAPCYSNGSRACFMGKDLSAALKEAGVSYQELDQLCISPYGTYMTVTSIDILTKDQNGTQQEELKGDVNKDGSINSVDLVVLSGIMLGKISVSSAYSPDVDRNGRIDVCDVISLKNILL